VTNDIDRFGRVIAVTNGANLLLRTYDLSGALLTETLNGVTVSNAFDAFLRRTNSSLLDPASSLLASTGYGYDPASRLQSVTAGNLTARYSYLANSPLLEQILFQQNGTTRMTTLKQHDFLNRLTGISSLPSASSAISFAYNYNQANQRTNVVLGADGSRWVYSYDSLGQVISGKKYWPDGTLVAGQQFEYTFDDIGNRKQTKTGGDAAGGNLRGANYTNDLLNQITGRDIPGTNDILGIAHASATVTVNGQTTYRKGEYYQTGLTLTNRDFALYPYVTNIAVLLGATEATTGRIFVARSPEVFLHDADGNLTNDGRWVYVWDAENRLTRMVSRSDTPSTSWVSLTFTYDPQGRRISKVVSNWTGTAWALSTDQRFVYDGWNLIAMLNSSFSLVNSFLWGLDLSGSLQGAGGVGGLICVNNATNGAHFAAFDGNGNVMALVNATNGTVSANFEYGPFGELLRATGPMANATPFRFSTKYLDDETDLLYYGFRYYVPTSGRWLNMDPIGERGGWNIYAFVGNAPSSRTDLLGQATIISEPAEMEGWPATYLGPDAYGFYTRRPSGTVTIPRCAIWIYAGHGHLMPAKLEVRSKDRNCAFGQQYGCATGGGIIRDYPLNGQYVTVLVPLGAYSSPGIPGAPARPNGEISDAQLIARVQQAFAAAQKQALKMCKRCCCDAVEISTKVLLTDQEWDRMRPEDVALIISLLNCSTHVSCK
jgi:RHS repeat-associated protein